MSTVTTKLPDKWKQRAKDELGEDEKEVEGSIQTLRSWAEQEPWLTTPTDSDFLLHYLRVRKFSQLEARRSLGNFWTQRKCNPQWFNPDVHPGNPAIIDMIKTGFYVVMPCEDKEGRRLLIERIASLNMGDIEKKYGSLDVIVQTMVCIQDWLHMDQRVQVNGFKVFIDASPASLDTMKLMNPSTLKKLQPIIENATQDWLHMDQRVQVNGFKVFIDASPASLDTMKLMNPSTLKKLQPIIEKSFPGRMKGLHIYGLPALVESLFQFSKALMNPKTRERLFLHSKMTSVYDDIEQHMLPKEYLPDDYMGDNVYTIQNAIDSMVREITKPEVVAHIKDLNSGKYGADSELRATTEAPAESFKKLNID